MTKEKHFLVGLWACGLVNEVQKRIQEAANSQSTMFLQTYDFDFILN